MQYPKTQQSPLINFFHHKLKPKLSCSIVGAEDYPIENLISCDSNKSNRGFIGYLSKPPISLDIVLVCPIQLMSIKIWPEIGSLKSTGFDILAKTNGRNENDKIANCDDLSESSVVFCRLNDSTVNVPSQMKKCFFFRNLSYNATVQSLTIRIFKTKNSSVPVLKKLEIWGRVNDKCALKEHIFDLWESRNSDTNNRLTASASHQSNDHPHSSKSTSNEYEIPDELLDAITHQIMTVPMTLPSGKTVDQSTLDKFNKIEATWGREPSDPFTGLTFTNNRKPIFNASLKSTIDKMLTVHPNLIESNNVPRTIGTVNGKRSAEQTTSNISKKLKCYAESSLTGIDVSGSTKYLFRAEDSEKISCYKCQSIGELYRIKTCGKDFICRMCLCGIDFVNRNVECRCRRPFSRNDVERHYDSSKAFSYRLS